ncbi:helix-turn-helix transcriptional regulator [Halobacillus karajensis]|uniref:Helix-turn-helix domain protein n=1 Tax=Halobacillus karajensis TaxID=195088 RepID=A0A059NWC7_9BACI|nr:helix-turn-helix domain-containing protein [Halobacillus karajensis]CDQ22633.1 Helix-turn-helix domain protein [Halobacillus karajensis]CDQ26115.1 Helix-turn-helix domain protein [Halobacillus karajensis]
MQTKLKGIRSYHKITAEEMAKEIGVHKDAYLGKENGRTEFKLNEMFTIAKRFNMRVDDLFSPTTSRHEKED